MASSPGRLRKSPARLPTHVLLSWVPASQEVQGDRGSQKGQAYGTSSSFMVLLERGALTWKLWPMCSSGGEVTHSAEPTGWRAGRSSSVRIGRPGEEEQELSGGQQEPCLLESCPLLRVSLLSRMTQMSRGLQKGAWRTPRGALLGRGGISLPSKERVTWGLSIPTLGHARNGQRVPGKKNSGQRLQP